VPVLTVWWLGCGQDRGLTTDDAYLFETADSAQRKMDAKDRKERNKAAFGWEVFNQDSLLKAYEKHLDKLPKAPEGGSKVEDMNPLDYGKAPKTGDEALERMVDELREREESE
jgi:pre-mRNA-splicing factor SYF2